MGIVAVLTPGIVFPESKYVICILHYIANRSEMVIYTLNTKQLKKGLK